VHSSGPDVAFSRCFILSYFPTLDDVAVGKGAALDDVCSSSKSGSHDEKEYEDINIYLNLFKPLYRFS